MTMRIHGDKIEFPDGTEQFTASSGGSGDSIWTEEDGVAVYDGDIKVNGVTVGLGNGDELTNTALGLNALIKNTGTVNTAIGSHALTNVEEGSYNTATGFYALSGLTTGEKNTAIGTNAGYTLTTGSDNICIGNGAKSSAPDVSNEVTIGNDDVEVTRLKGEVQTTQDIKVNGVTVGKGSESKDNNTVLGYRGLLNNTLGKHSVAVGFNSLLSNTEGEYNSSVGSGAMASNETGKNNVALGYVALTANTTGDKNIAIGANSLVGNKGGNDNVGIGWETLKANESGINNVGLGNYSLLKATGSRNTGLGMSALQNTTGDKNTAIGYNSGSNLTTGTNNTLVGNGAQPSSPDVSNEVTIGNDDVTRFTTVGGRFKYVLGASYNMLEMQSKDKNQFLRNLVYDNADNVIVSSGSLTLQTGTSNQAMVISDTGVITTKNAFITEGSVYTKNLPDGASQKQVLVGDDGRLFKSTTTFYSTEEVDKKLAIKDKLIEKLSARLDKLEKKVK